MFSLEEEELKEWLDDGVVCLREVFNLKWLNILERGFQESVKTPSVLSKDYAEDKKGSFYTDHAMHRRIEPINKFVRNSPVGVLAG